MNHEVLDLLKQIALKQREIKKIQKTERKTFKELNNLLDNFFLNLKNNLIPERSLDD